MAIKADYEPKESNGNRGWFWAEKSQMEIEGDILDSKESNGNTGWLEAEKSQMEIKADYEPKESNGNRGWSLTQKSRQLWYTSEAQMLEK